MASHTILLPSITPGITRTVKIERTENVIAVVVDSVEVLTRFRGRPWMVNADLTDISMLADGARALYRAFGEADE